MTDRTDLDLALARAGVDPRDDRGLLALADARKLAESATRFEGSETDRDRLWAALLSLESAREFVRHASRIEWSDEPAPFDDVAAFDRYGNGLLPWAEKTVRDGDLAARPATLATCLLEVGTSRAFDLLFELKSVGGERGEASRLLREWIEVHPNLGFSLLADRAEGGSVRARQLLRHLANLDPAYVFDHLAASRGREDTDALFDVLCVVRDLTEAAIVAVLDMAAEGEIGLIDSEWPTFHARHSQADVYHAMRLVAVRARSGNDWGILIERIGGSSPETAKVEAYRYGSRVSAGRCDEESLPLELTVTPAADDALCPCQVSGPAGPLEVTESHLTRLGLKQKGLTAMPFESQAFVIGLRAYLANRPRAFRRPVDEVAAALEIDDGQVILDSDSYTHVVGTTAEVATRRDRFWAARPGDTRVFRSLARAIVERDASLFRPGKTNLDWREHPLPRRAPTA